MLFLGLILRFFWNSNNLIDWVINCQRGKKWRVDFCHCICRKQKLAKVLFSFSDQRQRFARSSQYFACWIGRRFGKESIQRGQNGGKLSKNRQKMVKNTHMRVKKGLKINYNVYKDLVKIDLTVPKIYFFQKAQWSAENLFCSIKYWENISNNSKNGSAFYCTWLISLRKIQIFWKISETVENFRNCRKFQKL